MEIVSSAQLGFALCSLAAGLTIVLVRKARAAALQTDDSTYHVVEHDAGGGEAGSVTLRVEIVAPGAMSNRFGLHTSVLAVNPAPRWTYEVRKPGGTNAPVEVAFKSEYGRSTTFKARYSPGRTTIESGVVSRR